MRVRGFGVRSPLGFLSPPCRRHLALVDVLLVACLEVAAASLLGFGLWVGTCALYALLAEADGFGFVALFCDYDMRLGWVAGCALRLVVTGDTCVREFWVFLAHVSRLLWWRIGAVESS